MVALKMRTRLICQIYHDKLCLLLKHPAKSNRILMQKTLFPDKKVQLPVSVISNSDSVK